MGSPLLKHQWLFLNTLDNVETVEKLEQVSDAA